MVNANAGDLTSANAVPIRIASVSDLDMFQDIAGALEIQRLPRAGTMWMFSAPEPLFQSVQASRLTFVIKTTAVLVGSLSIDPNSGKTGFFAIGRRPGPDLYVLAAIPYPIHELPKGKFNLELQGLSNYVSTATCLRHFATGTPPFGDVLDAYTQVGTVRRR